MLKLIQPTEDLLAKNIRETLQETDKGKDFFKKTLTTQEIAPIN